MEPIRDDEFSHLSFLRDNPLAFYESFLNLQPVEGTGLVYYPFPLQDTFWKQRFIAALEYNGSLGLEHLASRFLIDDAGPSLFSWEDATVKVTAPVHKKPWVQMNEQYLRRAHRGRSKHKRR